jgi:hypothetical protein
VTDERERLKIPAINEGLDVEGELGKAAAKRKVDKYKHEIVRPALQQLDKRWLAAEAAKWNITGRLKIHDLDLDEWPMDAAKGWAQLRLQGFLSEQGLGLERPSRCRLCGQELVPDACRLMGECPRTTALIDEETAGGPWGGLKRLEIAQKWEALPEAGDIDPALRICTRLYREYGQAAPNKGKTGSSGETSSQISSAR